MTREEAKTEIMQIYGSLSEEKKMALDVLMAQEDGEHDGCKDCKHELKSAGEYPCSYCKQNYKDMWEVKEPTDTITMTREEFSEKLMEHYRQGRADEKAYQNGELMQSFNPD